MSRIVRVGELPNDGEDYAMWFESPHSQPTYTVQSAERYRQSPLATAVSENAVVETLHVVIRPEQPSSAALDAPLRAALLRTLDTQHSAVAITIANNDGSHERYRYYVTQAIDGQEDDMGGLHWVATLLTTVETKWRAVDKTTVIWNAYDSGAQKEVTNNGDVPAQPTYELRPTADRDGGWDKRVFAAVFANYPTPVAEEMPYDIADKSWNTAALVTAGKIASPENIGVIIDGEEVRRWITGYNTTTTQVWVNLRFTQPNLNAALDVSGLSSGDMVTEVVVSGVGNGIERWPTQGLFSIDNEIFSYTGRDALRRKFTGVSRAARDTVAANHLGYAPIRYIEHEIWLVYGGQTAKGDFYDDAPDGGNHLSYDDRKPTIDLDGTTCSNSLWSIKRWPGSDSPYRHPRVTPYGSLLGGYRYLNFLGGGLYDDISVTRASGTTIGPEGEERLLSLDEGRSYWRISMPGFPITRLSAEGTRRQGADGGEWNVYIHTDNELGTSPVISVPSPPASLVQTWWMALNVDVPWDYYPAIYFGQYGTTETDVTLAYLNIQFDAANRPIIFRTAEHDNYDMALTLANLTTGEAITLAASLVAATDVGLSVDTGRKAVTLLGDGSNQYGALTRDSHRSDILLLAPGLNTLQVDEDGLQGMQIVISFEERTYT